MKHLLFFSMLVCVLLTGCSEKTAVPFMPAAPDYNNAQMWYTSKSDADADVFYILPTCVWDWTDSTGNLSHYADVYNPEHIAALLPSNELACDIFGAYANFYSPYYRQITLESWIEGEEAVASRFPYAMDDVDKAFRHYMEKENNGRPFFIAGFSQGAKCVVELVKSLSEEEASRLIAAYVIGYRVTESDMAACPYLKPAQAADDTGVTICYNSVESPESICPVLSPSEFCINPLNWKTDATPAITQDTVTVAVNPEFKVLTVSGLDRDRYYLPILGQLFPKGNFHLQELELYKDALRENVKTRLESYRANNR